MTSDFRALCAELLSELENAIGVIYGEDGTRHISSADPVIAKADVALSEPEPERLTVQQINNLPEHGENFIYSNSKWPDEITLDGDFTRTQLQQLANSVPTSRSNKTMTELSPEALAEPDPDPAVPSDEELLELMPQQFRDDLATVSRMAAHGAGPDVGAGLFCVSLNTGALNFARAVEAATLARAQHQPVPVSERLPGPDDCDAEGRCWWFYPPDFMELCSHATAESAFVAGATHWLPAHALPLPGEVEG